MKPSRLVDLNLDNSNRAGLLSFGAPYSPSFKTGPKFSQNLVYSSGCFSDFFLSSLIIRLETAEPIAVKSGSFEATPY
jgi:hypothetical protein